MSIDPQLHRKKACQTYQVFLDWIILIMFMVSLPFLIIILYANNFGWINLFGLAILLYCFILMPLLYLWSKHRNWFSNSERDYFLSWKSPMLLVQMGLALIYPVIFCFYFSCLRYLKHGFEQDIVGIFFNLDLSNVLSLVFLLVVALPNIYIMSKTCLYYINYIRSFLWSHASLLIYSVHLACLESNVYFSFIEKLYKLHFIFNTLVNLNSFLNRYKNQEDHNYLRRFIHKVYFYPKIFVLAIIFITFITEIIFFEKIWFVYYLLFWFPIISILFTGFNYLGRSYFIKDVCMVDFLTKRVDNLRYPRRFWGYTENPESSFGLTINLTPTEIIYWTKLYQEHQEKNKNFHIPLSFSYNDKLLNKWALIKKRITLPIYYAYIKRAYFRTYHVRWP